MAIDIRKVVLTLAESALADDRPSAPEKPKPLLSTGRAVLLGAGLMTAGRVIASSRGRHVLGSIQEFVAEERLKLQGEDQDDYEDEEPEAEDFEDEDDYEDEEPEAETDEDFEDEEPEAETDEDFEDEEPEAEEDERPQRKPRRKAADRGRS
jgi:hypothetical protein